ncbi:hypothetical protein B0J13DRAFT_677952 [Dactylonectria estremocensis]|uniref:Uncharacterized protein n=1 Tax=Dactylonectria estremocensis TaxID=1079267 RepID=A0A9P9IXX8_9HYPO|nr:hypothetical protein B0J13DRAFT_677952 [Dactylonectria estremocensis]
MPRVTIRVDSGDEENRSVLELNSTMSKYQNAAIQDFIDTWPQHVVDARRGFAERSKPQIFEREGCASSDLAVFGSAWSGEDEAELMAEWNQSLTKHCIDGMNMDKKVQKLWKISIRTFGVDPLTIMEEGNLKVSISANKSVKFGGKSSQNPIWPTTFCEILGHIMCHPFWRGPDARKVMAFVLKYAVMCREGDAHFDVPNPVYCWVLDALFNQPPRLGITIHQMHMGIRHQRSGPSPSIESDLLAQLGGSIERTRDREPEGQGSSVITTRDLNNVVNALDSMENHGVVSQHSTARAVQLYSEVCYDKEIQPVGVPAFKQAYAACWLNCQRRRIIKERALGTNESEVSEIGIDDRLRIIPETPHGSPVDRRGRGTTSDQRDDDMDDDDMDDDDDGDLGLEDEGGLDLHEDEIVGGGDQAPDPIGSPSLGHEDKTPTIPTTCTRIVPGRKPVRQPSTLEETQSGGPAVGDESPQGAKSSSPKRSGDSEPEERGRTLHTAKRTCLNLKSVLRAREAKD